MPKIAAYHPVIEVSNGSKSELIELDLDNWYPNDEVVRALGEFTGASTGGGAVKVMMGSRSLRKKNNSICLGARILGGGEAEPTVCLLWDGKLD